MQVANFVLRQGGWPVQILDPNRVQKLLGVWRGGGELGRPVSRWGPQRGVSGYPNIHTSK